MIGYVSKGGSFLGCISYCLEDKNELTETMKQQLGHMDNLQHKDRAEVLEYNKCFGNKDELAEQFQDVAKLSRRVEKPVLHLSLRLAPGEKLTRNRLIEIGREAAKEFGVSDHQYICVLHKDTKEQHIHIAANRVGFDGKVASDSNSYKRMAALCRRLEKEYHLKEVLSPRAFLSPQERLLPRHDIRKERLREDIQRTLNEVSHYSEFEQKMKAMGYKVIKGRGICFIDDKKVKIKGSEVGFSLMKIEQILALKQELGLRQKENLQRQQPEGTKPHTSSHRVSMDPFPGPEGKPMPVIRTEKQITSLLSKLLEPLPQMGGAEPYELTEEYLRRKRKRHKISH
jgi:Relaxase/Mobilisation nuclease domain